MTNGEKYKTAEERADAFRTHCSGRNYCEKCKLIGSKNCSFTWLELEADDEKSMPCPFCGSKTHINIGHITDGHVNHWVDCLNPNCMYMSAHFASKAEAIAAHNRVCRTVKAAEKGEAK